ncbi:hypothetical protein MLD38_035141 [Melastoma candidum]|uniref:Uncharacterized protein n=1 Tax=Melastoma candidum TaxID=119954 RepID=A0ACB9MCK6_9MYRT|nr:hypothetical protein MLD38_035141 [Melastoma candidum]
MIRGVVLLLLPLPCLCFLMLHAHLLPQEEVDTLNTIAIKMKFKEWRVRRESCHGGDQGLNFTYRGGSLSNVTCNCSFAGGTLCHITAIQLKRLNMTGVFPEEFGNLPYLRIIDLTRNYLSGTIPTSITRLPLEILSALGNRFSGTIPKEIGDISTLEELVLNDNLLQGSLHPNLGKLSRLRRLVLSGNNFTGTIPESFSHLQNLTEFRIDGNSLSGKIPSFIGNWTGINILDLQGTSMEGPIPPTISLLKNLTELRISDLSGSSSNIPDLQYAEQLKVWIMRNCSLNGSLPDSIGKKTILDTLLSGEIPSTIQNAIKLRSMFLSNNSLSGVVPPWIRSGSRKWNFDLSYNNFDFEGSSTPLSCQPTNINLISSYSSTGNDSAHWCLEKDLPCPHKAQESFLFINCGGGTVTYEGNNFAEDTSTYGRSNFFWTGNWAYSSMGVFIAIDNASYIANSPLPSLNMTGYSDLYKTARLSPSSLRYYGLCMKEGSYKVRLYFAEIQYTNDETFYSLGRRIFDVAIQGKVVLRDFNIAKEAGGAGKGIHKDFDDIRVKGGTTLEIHLYWVGKGTTAVPERGMYGPLISAIQVTPNYHVGTRLSVGVILGIAASSCILSVLILLVLRRMFCLARERGLDNELRGIHLQTGRFSMRQIKSATGNFHPSNKIGEGGFGPVYKGTLTDGTIIAVKQLSSKSKQGNREFINEIGMISALQHPNLVKLYGCCVEGNQLLLVYEYMENNSLARALFGEDDQKLKLNWVTRKRICLGIARGLAHLHEESRLKIVHRDIKATNVLLDKDLNAKISDFGLAKLDEEENTHISTRIAGTIGYMAPEYAMRGYLTDKADVYSFGVVTLEIVSGKSNTNYRPREHFVYLLDWAYVLYEQGNLLELVDLSLGLDYDQEEALRMLNLAILCTNSSPTLRPPMSSVVSMLEGKCAIQAPIVKRNSMQNPDLKFKAFEMLSQESMTNSSMYSQGSSHQVTKSMSIEGPLFDPSTSSTGKDDKSLEEKVLLNF